MKFARTLKRSWIKSLSFEVRSAAKAFRLLLDSVLVKIKPTPHGLVPLPCLKRRAFHLTRGGSWVSLKKSISR